ncbi:MAG: SocA family protein [Parcubacteria group bacterium]|nr:SocA family protein [Parcubacteria group bacterium]
MSLHIKKYQQAILYFCWKLDKEVRGKKKLAKLLYYLDFDYYEKYEKYFTGEVYKKLPMGPFPVSLEKMTTDMAKKKQLIVKKVNEWDGYNPTEIYKASKKPDVLAFSANEKKMLDRIIRKYGCLNGKQLENLTHSEAPYIGAEDKKEIPYELAFYRGTNFDHA